jgi:NAD(P)-dependent dehydrogenase (short-subunit alcohol dehydrogenase family)
VEGSHDGTVLGVVGDVTVAGDNERAVARALSAFGRLDTFVGNAGLFDYGARLVDTPTSLSSRNAGVGGAVYTASKHAVVGLVEQLAFELALAVRVNGVAPGFMRTDIRGPRALGLADTTLDSMPDLDELARALLPLRFLPDPADYTGHYVQLASRERGCDHRRRDRV